VGAGSTGIILDDLDRTPNPVFKVTAFLKPNISKTVRFRDKVTKEH